MIGPQTDDIVEPTLDELRVEYEAYRLREGRSLVFMLPREAVRPLLRRAYRSGTVRSGGSDDDALEMLADFCGSLLPLPPFEVWLEDRRRWPDAHLRGLEEAPSAPSASTPLTLDARGFRAGGRQWTARLRAFRDDDAWRGFIAFRAEGTSDDHRTSLVFREHDPAAVRDRFRSFESAALESFLRSARP